MNPAPTTCDSEAGIPRPASQRPTLRWGVILLAALLFLIVLMVLPLFLGGLVAKYAKLRAQEDMTGMRLAITAYHTEYRKFPVAASGGNEAVAVETTGPMLPALTGAPSSLNVRQIRFLDILPSRNGRTGLVTTASGGAELCDPWGTPYQAHFDFDGDGYIADPEHPGTRIKGPVLLYSAGRDRDPATWGDNVRSWKP